MTEAMSHREIEGVLSSVKRLVSQESQQRPPAEPRHEKLVLTSALRVLPDTAPESAEHTGEAQTSAAPEGDPVATSGIGDAPLPESQATDPAPAVETPLPSSLIRRIAQAGAVPGAAPGADRAAHDAQETAFDAFEPAPPERQPEDPQALEDSALEATLARLEAVLSGQPVPPQAGAPSGHDDSAGPSAPAQPPRTETDQIIDEGMLYQLVAHIVRQELQGELGEKITRNIRKLVRQEVAREMQLRRD